MLPAQWLFKVNTIFFVSTNLGSVSSIPQSALVDLMQIQHWQQVKYRHGLYRPSECIQYSMSILQYSVLCIILQAIRCENLAVGLNLNSVIIFSVSILVALCRIQDVQCSTGINLGTLLLRNWYKMIWNLQLIVWRGTEKHFSSRNVINWYMTSGQQTVYLPQIINFLRTDFLLSPAIQSQ